MAENQASTKRKKRSDWRILGDDISDGNRNDGDELIEAAWKEGETMT